MSISCNTLIVDIKKEIIESSRDRAIRQEHADSKWITVGELDQYDWAPADVPIVSQIQQTLSAELS